MSNAKHIERTELNCNTRYTDRSNSNLSPRDKAYETVVVNTNRIADQIEHVDVPLTWKISDLQGDADIRLQTLCEGYLPKRFSDEQQLQAKERLESELALIRRNHYAYKYLWMYDFIQKSRMLPSQFGIRGCGAGSMVCYLLGISKSNPIDDSMPLYYEFFMGEDGSRIPDVEFNVDDEIFCVVSGLAKEVTGGTERMKVISHSLCTLNTRLAAKTGYYPSEVDIRSEEITQLFSSAELLRMEDPASMPVSTGLWGIPGFDTFGILRMVDRLKPKSIADLNKVMSLYHGTEIWFANGEYLFADGKVSLDTIIASREDLFEAFLGYGFSRERALYLTTLIQKGMWARGKIDFGLEKEMENFGVPHWLIWLLKRIKYLFPRAHEAEYLQMELRALYYKLHFPEEYYPLYFELFGNAFIQKYYFHGSDDDFFRLAKSIDEETVETLYQYIVWREARSRWVA